MTTNRSDYVLVWTPKDTDASFYCSLCRVEYKGTHCPGHLSTCAKQIDSTYAFDNTKHTIVATKDYCKAKQYGCRYNCSTCVLANTYSDMKIIDSCI